MYKRVHVFNAQAHPPSFSDECLSARAFTYLFRTYKDLLCQVIAKRFLALLPFEYLEDGCITHQMNPYGIEARSEIELFIITSCVATNKKQSTIVTGLSESSLVCETLQQRSRSLDHLRSCSRPLCISSFSCMIPSRAKLCEVRHRLWWTLPDLASILANV